MTPGQRIRAGRKALGLTQAQAAEAYGCSQPRWAEIEVQRFDPQIQTLSRAARVVGLTLAEMFADATIDATEHLGHRAQGDE